MSEIENGTAALAPYDAGLLTHVSIGTHYD